LDDVEVVEEFTYPTCTPVYAYVEAISNVTFAGIDNDSDPEDEMLSYEDFTAIAGNVTIGQSYPITVQGNTWGDFDTFISAYIDWNQNGSYDDAGEYYEIGVITDSDGTDGIQASGNIAVPADAMVGTTTMRIVKNYDEYAPGPCASAADGLFGQTEEYTLNVGTLGAPAFDTANFKSYPNPMNNHLNLEYANIMERVTIYNLLGQTVKAFDIN